MMLVYPEQGDNGPEICLGIRGRQSQVHNGANVPDPPLKIRGLVQICAYAAGSAQLRDPRSAG